MATRHDSHHTVGVTCLRPQVPEDLPLLTGGESPFDEFGPKRPRESPRPTDFEHAGGLTIVSPEGDIAGEVDWHPEQWGPNRGSVCVMIGVWLRSDHRGRGLGTVAQAELVDLIFRHTTTNRVEAHTDVENLAEQHSLEKVGFQREGIIRGSQWRDGAYHDGYLYSLLRHDRRLSPAGESAI